jgi:hypothetical protein
MLKGIGESAEIIVGSIEILFLIAAFLLCFQDFSPEIPLF